jgi:hypothetical protein
MPRMDSNDDKVIQSHALIATGFVCVAGAWRLVHLRWRSASGLSLQRQEPRPEAAPGSLADGASGLCPVTGSDSRVLPWTVRGLVADTSGH